ncbi:MAG TPA: hypothetical protein VNN07_06105 [Candidatus Tectomicrobia bacterium]|nr:hypothetical protein [Candidatus Tectomicrobia bacterium]
MRSPWWTGPVVAVIGMLGATGVAAHERELQRYYESIVRICHTGVTPEIQQAYEAAAAAVERARYGGGRDNNFFGVRTPEQAWLSCFQSPDGGRE